MDRLGGDGCALQSDGDGDDAKCGVNGATCGDARVLRFDVADVPVMQRLGGDGCALQSDDDGVTCGVNRVGRRRYCVLHCDAPVCHYDVVDVPALAIASGDARCGGDPSIRRGDDGGVSLAVQVRRGIVTCSRHLLSLQTPLAIVERPVLHAVVWQTRESRDDLLGFAALILRVIV